MAKPGEMKEEPYEFALVVKITGYGNQEHQDKEAAIVKRMLEVKMHREVEVFVAPNLKPKTTKLIPVTWSAPGIGSVE